MCVRFRESYEEAKTSIGLQTKPAFQYFMEWHWHQSSARTTCIGITPIYHIRNSRRIEIIAPTTTNATITIEFHNIAHHSRHTHTCMVHAEADGTYSFLRDFC